MNQRKINRVSTGRHKMGIDGIKLAVIMVGLMVAIAVFLVVVGNVDLSHIGVRNTEDDYIEDSTTDVIVNDRFVSGPPLRLPAAAADALFYYEEGGLLELPLIGATGWVAVSTALRATASNDGDEITAMQPGTGFTILADSGDWWRVELPDGTTGWVDWRRCFVNLPDVLPSIVYNITNASASSFRSSGYALAGITGQPLYSARAFNARLGRYEYIVPAMLPMARALFGAQQQAQQIGHTLVIYEAFRPQSAQTAMANAVQALMRDNASANDAITRSSWPLIWFISTGTSNHQRGGTIDVTLARIGNVEVLQTGAYSFVRVTNHTEMAAISPIHEMGPASAITETPRGITTLQIINETANLTGAAMTSGIARMQLILATAGLNPLSSLWWQFDHSPSITMATSSGIVGDFYTATVYSVPPTR